MLPEEFKCRRRCARNIVRDFVKGKLNGWEIEGKFKPLSVLLSYSELARGHFVLNAHCTALVPSGLIKSTIPRAVGDRFNCRARVCIHGTGSEQFSGGLVFQSEFALGTLGNAS